MTHTNIRDLTLEEGVSEFIRRHNAEAALQQACARVEACFPEARAIAVSLLEDPDEENHTWVVLRVILPADHPVERLEEQHKHYYEMDSSGLPYHPFSFSVDMEYVEE